MSSVAPVASLKLTANLVGAYVRRNHVPVAELAAFIQEVHVAFVRLDQKRLRPQTPQPRKRRSKPMAETAGSFTDEYIVSLENGKRYRFLAKHLKALGLSPDEYRTKWNLPADYPLIALAYSQKRSALAKRGGSGQQSRD